MARPQLILLAGVLALPLAGLVVLLAAPDRRALGASALALLARARRSRPERGARIRDRRRRRRRGDRRVHLVSLAFLAASGFPALHALATLSPARRLQPRLRGSRRRSGSSSQAASPRFPRSTPTAPRLPRCRTCCWPRSPPGSSSRSRSSRRRRDEGLRAGTPGRSSSSRPSGSGSSPSPWFATRCSTASGVRRSCSRSQPRSSCSLSRFLRSRCPATGRRRGGSGTCSCSRPSP